MRPALTAQNHLLIATHCQSASFPLDWLAMAAPVEFRSRYCELTHDGSQGAIIAAALLEMYYILQQMIGVFI